MDRLSIDTFSDDTGSSHISRKSESRCENFVTFEEHQKMHRHQSADVLARHCDIIPNAKILDLRRSASDPCIVDAVESENEVFGAATLPYLHVEMPTPRKRRSSQTRTTYL